MGGTAEFVPQMLERADGVMKEHARTCVAHDGLHPKAHVGAVAVDGAAAAGGLGIAKLASLKARVGVGEELLARCAKLFVALVLTAVEANHLRYDALFVVNLHWLFFLSLCANRLIVLI